MIVIIITVYLDKQLSGDSTEEMPVAPGSVDDYEIEKKYEMVCDVSLYKKFKLCVCVSPIARVGYNGKHVLSPK